MTGTTAPLVIDTLITRWKALAFPAGTLISDGFPGPNEPVVIVAIGGTQNPTVDGVQSWAYLGAKTKEEVYKIECMVSVVLGGDGQQAEVVGPDPQKAARDLAMQVFHAIEADLIADPTLGQLFNTPPVKGGWAGVEDVRLMQSDDITAATGSIADVAFNVRVKALI
jgi:hypothetical protein